MAAMTRAAVAESLGEAPVTLASSEERYRALVEISNAVVWRPASDGRAPEGPPHNAKEFVRQYLGGGWLDAIHPQDRERALEEWNRSSDSKSAVYRILQDDGVYRWAHARALALRNADGVVREWIGTLTDIHAERAALKALEDSDKRLRLALDSAGLGVWDHDFTSGSTWWSESKLEVLGSPGTSGVGLEGLLQRVDPEDREAVGEGVAEACKATSGGRFYLEYRITRASDGAKRWLSSSGQVFFDLEGVPQRMVGTVADITPRREQQDRIYYLAHFDCLTGLANRTSFWEQVDALLKQGKVSALLMIDLDGFKDVNDTIGHQGGDQLLEQVAQRLNAQLVGQGHVIARVGGDEFAIALSEGSTPETASALAVILRETLSHAFTISGRSIFVGCSIGIALAPAHGNTTDELVRSADLALYRAKLEGRNASRLFMPEMLRESEIRQSLGVELRRAFKNGEFELYYQPQVSLGTGAIVGVEALLRWNHPTRGLLAPASFLSVLKKGPLAEAVGVWVLRQALGEAARWVGAGHEVPIGVNLFSAQFRAGNLEAVVRSALQESQVRPDLLELEITENVILKNDSKTLYVLNKLRALGVRIAFDDYGTGYASLSMLKLYPLTRLKVDRSFVSNLGSDSDDTAILEAILHLGQRFRLEVVVEGIETGEQMAVLTRLGAKIGQGYLFGRPVPIDAFRHLLSTHNTEPVARHGRSMAEEPRSFERF